MDMNFLCPSDSRKAPHLSRMIFIHNNAFFLLGLMGYYTPEPLQKNAAGML
ncbi:MAG: hypothetical protein IJS39_01865 [Synergistaceae bacterium]|nr:hypothetical protein [Synergistaceae bacterium]